MERFLRMGAIVLVGTGLVLSTTLPSYAESETGDLVERTVLAASQGKRIEAIQLAHQALEKSPDDLRSRLLLSYLSWQHGDILQALESGQKAVQLDPKNVLALTNLAKMNESIGDHIKALELYSQAQTISPSNTSAVIGKARVLSIVGRNDESVQVLAQFETLPESSFDFATLVSLSDTYRAIGRPELAVAPASKSRTMAKSHLDIGKANAAYMDSLLRSGQVQQARRISPVVFRNCQAKNFELYVRAADQLFDSNRPDLAKKIVLAALKQLDSSEEADGLYKIGRIIEERAVHVKTNTTKFHAWMKLANSCHAKAVALEPRRPHYHLALAGVSNAMGNEEACRSELEAAAKLSPQDPFPASLLDSINRSQRVSSSLGKMSLRKAEFQAKGIICNCHVGKFIQALSKIDGVVLASLSGTSDPYSGVIVFDPAKTSYELVVQAFSKEYSAGPKLKDGKELSLTKLSEEGLQDLQELTRLSANLRLGEVLQFFNWTQTDEPLMPTFTAARPRAISLKD